jgi:HSP20 family protein
MTTFYLRNPYRKINRRAMWEAFNDHQSEDCPLFFPIDVRVTDDIYLVEALLPGILAEDLDIQVENNIVTIKGEAKYDHPEDERFLLRERPTGTFMRTIELPDDVDTSNVDAELTNGVLKLRLPKTELAKPRKIKISNN